MKTLLFIGFILPFLVFSQEVKKDTINSVENDTLHSVKKATILSAILPGAGQVYNHLAMPKGKKKAFWKVPLIYAGLGATGYMVLQNNALQRELKQEYKTRVAGNTGLEIYKDYDLQGIETLYNQHLNRRDLFIVGFGIVYLIQVVDATVEAHFVSFDISEDLSLKISPRVLSSNQVGVGLSLSFK